MIFCLTSRRRDTRYWRDWSSDVCSSDLGHGSGHQPAQPGLLRVVPGQGEQHRQGRDALAQVGPGSPAGGAVGDDVEQVDRKSVAKGMSVDLGGRRIIKKKLQDCTWFTRG